MGASRTRFEQIQDGFLVFGLVCVFVDITRKIAQLYGKQG